MASLLMPLDRKLDFRRTGGGWDGREKSWLTLPDAKKKMAKNVSSFLRYVKIFISQGKSGT